MLVKLLTAKCKRAIQDSLTFTLPKVRVKVNQGRILGVIEKLPDGKAFHRFSGIPYAIPPINELRFRSPQKLLKFDREEVDCRRERDASFHKSGFHRKYVGSEDCLNLNLYVPSSAASDNKLPVMVFIHGGGMVFDSNSRDFYSPEFLLMEDVIVVTINYRLHAFGFTCLPSMGINGNAGLKDQQLALEWVHENIANFNGNPDNICLFGESAGAACVHLHTLNQKSKKFIKSAIMQSNCALADWFIQKDGEDKSRRLAQVLGGVGNSDQDCLDVLMKASPQKLYDNQLQAIDPNSDQLRRNLPFIFKPVIEKESDDAFLTKSPADLIKGMKDDSMPMIIGLCDGDGMTMGNFYRNKKLPLFDADYVKMLPTSVNLDPMSEEAEKVAKGIKEFYFGEKPIDLKTLPEFCTLMTDYQYTIPQTMANELHTRYQPSRKQFVYEFSYDGELNVFKKLLKMDELKGACHFDDIFYLFDCKFVGMQVPEDSPAGKLRRTMCRMWTNFAKCGNPTPENSSLPFKWIPLKPPSGNNANLKVNFLRINETLEMQEELYKDRMYFWRAIYDKYNSGLMNPKP